MQIFRDLYIYVGRAKIEDFITTVIELTNSNSNWNFEKDKANDFHGKRVYSFKYSENTKLPIAGLTIFNRDDRSWYVPNIVPLNIGELSRNQYNSILKNFYEKLVIPAANNLDIKTELTSDQVHAKDFLGKQNAELLNRFSNCANKSTGRSHPSDAKRWLEFVTSTYYSNPNIDIELLERILKEQGWSEEKAWDLTTDFEYALSVLRHAGNI